jgi:O-antigen/teichoic acid export membrane protein
MPGVTGLEEPLLDEPAASPSSFGVRVSKAVGMHDAGRVLRDFMLYLPAQFLPALAAALALLLLPRRMQPTPYGILQLALAVVTVGWIVVSQWVTGSITRELPAARVRDDVAAFSHTFGRALRVVVVLFAAFSAIVGVAGIFSHAIGDNLVLILVATAGTVTQNIAVTLYSAMLRPFTYAVVLLLSRVGGIGVGIWLVYRHNGNHGVTLYLASIAVFAGVVGGIALVAAFPRAHGRAPKEPTTVRQWFEFGVPSAVSNFLVWAMLFVDRFILSILRTVGEVGVYSLGATVGSQVVTIPAMAFMIGARPLAIKAFEEKGRAEVERLMRSWTRIVLLIALPCAAFVSVTAEPLLRFGPGAQKGTVFYPALKVIPIVAFGTAIYVLAGIGNIGLTVAKKMRPLMWSAGLGLGANVVANLILVPRYGINGAAVATPIASAVYLVAAQRQAQRYASWSFPVASFVRCCLATLAASAVGWLAIHVLRHPLTQARAGEAIALAAVAGGMTYVGALFVLGELRHRT